LKNYGSWMYCEACNNTIGYLCYSTYDYFKLEFECNCGEHGSVELGEKISHNHSENPENLMIKKGRQCCPRDQSPLFSIVEKSLKNYNYQVICKECKGCFHRNK
ncbi:MAG: hypothetical protein AAGU75_21845, partial [Bacillota bacterium]